MRMLLGLLFLFSSQFAHGGSCVATRLSSQNQKPYTFKPVGTGAIMAEDEVFAVHVTFFREDIIVRMLDRASKLRIDINGSFNAEGKFKARLETPDPHRYLILECIR